LLKNQLFTNQSIAIDQNQFDLRDELLAMAKRTGAVAIDPFAAICKGILCSTTSDMGIPIFKDDTHFNPDWAIHHAIFIDRVVSQ
jgi:hypothetical protein